MPSRTAGVSRACDRAPLLAAASFATWIACGCGDSDTTSLVQLAALDDAYVAIEQSHVACRCSGINLFGCPWSCATDVEVYALRIAREPAADGAECPAPIDATADATGGVVGEVEASFDCGEARYEWSGQSPPTRITIEDGTATWTISDPFVHPGVTLLAPAAEDLGAGVTVSLDIPGVELRDPIARILQAEGEPIALEVAVDDERVELTIPSDLAAGAHHDLSFSSATELRPSACQGPPACLGFHVQDSWSFYVPPEPIRDDDCQPIADSACDADLVCYLAGPDGETQCLPPGTTPIGDPCEVASDCVPGAGCHPSRQYAGKQCYELCEVQPSDPISTCPADQLCSWLNAAGHNSLGACTTP